MRKSTLYIIGVIIIVASLLQGCFTGVESTKKITEKDVKRAFEEMDRGKKYLAISHFVDSVPAWRDGKPFWVVDQQARLIFSPSSEYDIDSLLLEGKQLFYNGYVARRQVDNREVIDLHFTDGFHNLVYPTGRTLEEISHAAFTVPFLVDGDMIAYYASMIVGKTVYVKTESWLTLDGEKMDGRKFIPVVITSVSAGNRIYPLKVEFKTGDGSLAMLWMTTGWSSISGRDFDSLFSLTDVRLQYPEITAETWARIVDGKVAVGMTKQECRLSMGNPKTVNQLPDQTGLREYWHYDGGRYLFFVDGLLKEFR